MTNVINQKSGKNWTNYHADCVEVAQSLPSDSIHHSIYSPPFKSLYTYSNSERDMGNCRDDETFWKHYKFLIAEQFRVMMPGRIVAVHCMNLPTSKSFHGYIGISDFRGEIIRAFQEAGFIYHSEVTIWKDPVTAMQRTKALGLLHKQVRKDSCMSRAGIPDYLCCFRKPGENPKPVSHTPQTYAVEHWQRVASPVWASFCDFDEHGFLVAAGRKNGGDPCGIDPGDTLQREGAREHNDERHICPLQLEVIERSIELYSNPGEIIWSPFSGIGSEGYVAVRRNRKFIGSELKESYWKHGCMNLLSAENERDQKELL